ncbi:hypothetical protein R3P38DRAFT_2839683 [Favolaschia claudopus]|uniref:Yippee domain-containing protein n=1 Tax=Favolaschia claudopus TaxID=2862362 RepID=A0AAW0E003_9AGAR
MLAVHQSQSPRRRLPTLPQNNRLSRPLPPIPRPLCCKRCQACITSYNAVLPASAIPPDSRRFRGFSLFTETYNVTLLPPKMQLMQTGAHVLAEITCSHCQTSLGYKIVRAADKSESWKDGKFLLEHGELVNPHRPDMLSLDASDSEDSS